jgi:hypothetical protein
VPKDCKGLKRLRVVGALGVVHFMDVFIVSATLKTDADRIRVWSLTMLSLGKGPVPERCFVGLGSM